MLTIVIAGVDEVEVGVREWNRDDEGFYMSANRIRYRSPIGSELELT